MKIHAFSRHSILTAHPQPIHSRFLAHGHSRAQIHRSLEGRMACERAQNRSKSSLPISMGRNDGSRELDCLDVARKRRGPLAVTGVSDLQMADAIILLHGSAARHN